MSDVALWYLRYGQPDYDLCDTEEEAARYGAYMAEDGGGSVLGAQFPDGRVIARDDWAAYALAVRQQEEEWRQQAAERRAAPPPVMRDARDPFEGKPLQIEVSEPAWLGAPATARRQRA